ncbi:MAG: hypothetical protein ACLVCH_03015 [Roseburia inulinivorans]
MSVANIRKNGLQTGFFATEHLLPLLVEAGETELAYDILLQEGCPGWMYQIKCGATTTWERWDALKPDGTVNEEKWQVPATIWFLSITMHLAVSENFIISIFSESNHRNRVLQNCISSRIRTDGLAV